MRTFQGINPFQKKQQPTVRVQMPSGMGSTVSARGLTFEADPDGVLTLPRDIADELQNHLSAPAPRSQAGITDASADLQKIADIDARLAEIQIEKATYEAAVQRAEQMGASATGAETDVTDLQVKHKRSVVDMLLGLAKRADVDAIEAQRKKAVARAAEEATTRQLAALGMEELREQHIFPLDREAAELRKQRARCVARAIRASAEAAGHELRTAMRDFVRQFGVVQAHGELLLSIEKGVPLHETQAFGKFVGNCFRDLPAFAQLAAFADCGGGALDVALNPAMARAIGAQELVDVAVIEQQLRARFAEQGLL